MDWNRAIEINQTALSRIVAALIAMLGLASGGRIAQPLYRAVLRVLHPAESAVRRLIVAAARGLVVNLPPARPMPKGLALAGKGSGRVSFQLFDPRQQFNRTWRASPRVEPRIRSYDSLFQPRPVESAAPKPDDTIDATHLGRRLAAIEKALENLPRQARRLVRWQARRAKMQSSKFRSPLRPGPPPGHRKMATDEVDWVLRECHVLAWDALTEDTS